MNPLSPPVHRPFDPDVVPSEHAESTSAPSSSLDAQAQLEGEERFRWFHFKIILIAGIGYFTDAYDLSVIASIKPMLTMARYPGVVTPMYTGDLRQHGVGDLPTLSDLLFSAFALIGTLLGQLIFGCLGDRLGRKGAYGITLLMMLVMTLLQVCASWGGETTFTVLFLLWRFLLGIGIGGDYPLSATTSSEYASTKLRGPMVAAVKSMQGFGILSASLVGMAVVSCFRASIAENCTPSAPCPQLDACWRIVMGIGAIPAALTLYLRVRLPESPRFTAQVDRDKTLAAEHSRAAIAGQGSNFAASTGPKVERDRITIASFKDFVTRRRNFWILVGCCVPWFCCDIAYYSQTLFSPDILTNIGFNPTLTLESTGEDMAHKAFQTCLGNMILALCGTVPGFFPVILLVNRMGRKTIQLLGFAVMIVALTVMAAAYPLLLPTAQPPNAASVNGIPWVYMLLFCMMFFFANFGPNSTEFIIPGELFPTKFRSTCHGISAACGKAGAVVGCFGFGWMVIGAKNHISTAYPLDSETHAMQLAVGLMAVVCMVGLLATLLVPETSGRTLEEIVATFHDWEEFPSPTGAAQDLEGPRPPAMAGAASPDPGSPPGLPRSTPSASPDPESMAEPGKV